MASEYELRFFKEKGFTRGKCPNCGRSYWSLGEHVNCGETPCQEYVFLDNSPMAKTLRLTEMRETFQRFFEERGHKRVKRYPIVARWRDDVFYTQASVYPFQPWVIAGLAEPPANPLVISQPCVRFNDIDNVGRTGQHFTMFEMMAHHAFNYKDQPVYFKEKTTELCHEFMVGALGIQPAELRYVESWWEGGGNSGPCFEVTTRGAEVATLVFMIYSGEGKRRQPMNCQVVDTGYGLERLTWVSQGAPSAYEAVFGEVLRRLKEVAGVETDPELLSEFSKVAGGMNVETHGDVRQLRLKVAARVGISVEELVKRTSPLEDLYALCDHARALAFVLGDGVVPSNVKEGYFARLLVRRALRALGRREIDLGLDDLVAMQIGHFASDFPELKELEEDILKLLRVEEARYAETLKKGKKIVQGLGRKVGVRELVELYDSHGLVPEVVQEFAGTPVDIPDDFFSQVAIRHLQPEAKTPQVTEAPKGFPPTELLFYQDPKKLSFSAKILGMSNGNIILDKTYFYPEGGGQEADTGLIGDLKVVDVQLAGGVVLHKVKGGKVPKMRGGVACEVDEKRRMRLTRHHTATHIVNGAARAVLGQHVWQAGAHKSEERGTLDITHYTSLTKEEMEAIETLANKVVMENRQVHQSFVPREVAESEHGFGLYQGGSIPGREIRVVDIESFDAEACGGTHLFHTGEVGMIKLLRSRRIQDGVVRLEYVAGQVALEHFRRTELALEEASETLRTSTEKLPEAVRKLLDDWKESSKELERLRSREAVKTVEDLLNSAEVTAGARLVVHSVKGGMADLLPLAKELLSHPRVACVLGASDGSAAIIVGRGEDLAFDSRLAIQKAAPLLGGKGGGKQDFAQGGGPRVDKLKAALSEAAATVKKLLER